MVRLASTSLRLSKPSIVVSAGRRQMLRAFLPPRHHIRRVGSFPTIESFDATPGRLKKKGSVLSRRVKTAIRHLFDLISLCCLPIQRGFFA